MSQMQLLPELTAYLNRTKIILTVRKYNMRPDTIYIEGVGPCFRLPIGEIHNKEELEPYYQQSGFNSLDAWWKAIKKFIRTPGPYYLYEITKGDR